MVDPFSGYLAGDPAATAAARGICNSVVPLGHAAWPGASRLRVWIRKSLEAEDFMNLLYGSDPVKIELNRLENDVRDKDWELGEAQAEIRALRLSERAQDWCCGR